MSNGWMKKDSDQEEKISGITQVLLDTAKIRTLKVLSNRSKTWWLFICLIIVRGLQFIHQMSWNG